MEVINLFLKGIVIEVKKIIDNGYENHRWRIDGSGNVVKLIKVNNNKQIFPITEEETIQVEILTPVAVINFETKVLTKKGNDVMYIELPKKPSSVIRRSSARITIKQQVEFCKEIAYFIDLSGTGAYVLSKREHKLGEKCEIKFSIIAGKDINIFGEIVRKEKLIQNKTIKNYGYGLKFLIEQDIIGEIDSQLHRYRVEQKK